DYYCSSYTGGNTWVF
nr:immunoglobulin light chain junction region [Macaca mulatta]MOY05028.1 immunoglobulin light chain junction region [Macaca mulatta]MOY05271.1 immunoglobulin light chain junction region [Macaca mulatta]MOY05332.1 immunoglobulin light chain junction region [Macaca mulatta]MOY05363.1 immunoglobulin light chain junction region [Macaca mulatta]